MSDEIQVRSKCTDCINGNLVVSLPTWDGFEDIEFNCCSICNGTGYLYRWVTYEEAGIQQPADIVG